MPRCGSGPWIPLYTALNPLRGGSASPFDRFMVILCAAKVKSSSTARTDTHHRRPLHQPLQRHPTRLATLDDRRMSAILRRRGSTAGPRSGRALTRSLHPSPDPMSGSRLERRLKNAEEASHSRADHQQAPRSRSPAVKGHQDPRGLPQARGHRADVLPLAQRARRQEPPAGSDTSPRRPRAAHEGERPRQPRRVRSSGQSTSPGP